jgi:phosphate starvation-inducible membrane PsiE
VTDSAAVKKPEALRLTIARGFTRVEDIVYIGLGVLLGLSAAALLVNVAIGLARSVLAGAPAQSVVDLLDRMLLILMIVELLYTVQVSFREHTLVPEPFLIVGLIAVTRRILVVTAQVATVFEKGDDRLFRSAMIELALLTVMVLVLVLSLRLLRKGAAKVES